jgi:hypothetical protein
MVGIAVVRAPSTPATPNPLGTRTVNVQEGVGSGRGARALGRVRVRRIGEEERGTMEKPRGYAMGTSCMMGMKMGNATALLHGTNRHQSVGRRHAAGRNGTQPVLSPVHLSTSVFGV